VLFLWRSLQEAGGQLVELRWQDRAVVAKAQTPHRRCSQSSGARHVTGEDAAAWLIPDNGGGGRDLYSQLWHGMAEADAHGEVSALVMGDRINEKFRFRITLNFQFFLFVWSLKHLKLCQWTYVLHLNRVILLPDHATNAY
jgi:hypothetical protein